MTTEQALLELQAPDPKARVRAIRWLRVRGGPKAIEALIGALDDPDEDVRLRALDSLEEMKAGEAVPALMERLQSDQSPGWRWNYIRALRQIGDRQAVPALIAALNDPDERIVSDACAALRSFGEMEGVEPLLRLLDDPRWLVRKAACEALFELEVTDDRLVAALERLVQEPPPLSPDWGRLAEEAGVESAQYPWLDAMAGFGFVLESQTGQTEQERLQSECREMLKQLERRRDGLGAEEADRPDGEDDPAAELEAALAQLQDPDPKKREAAVEHLGRLDAPEAAAAVVRALDDPKAGVRSAAAISVARWELPEAVPVLIRRLLSDESSYVRRFCARRLEPYYGEEVTAGLQQALTDTDENVVCYAAITLRNRGDRQAIPSLLALLEHPDRPIRLVAAEMLLDLQAADQRLVEALEKLAQDPEAEEYDLEVGEDKCTLDRQRELAREIGYPEPREPLTMAEMVEHARQLLRET